MPANPELIKALAVTAKVMGTMLDEDAARMFADDLSAYPLPQVMAALSKCRREVKGRLTVSDVVSRLADGRPGAEEAWAMLPKSENDSVVWCEEMAKAFGVAGPLLAEGDAIAARMAFKEAYTQAVSTARDNAVPVKWSLSMGHDKSGRAQAVRAAADAGRIGSEKALAMLQNIGPEYVEAHRAALEGPKPITELLPHLKGDAA